MPRGDRTGPGGTGPRTGWGAGYCGGFNSPGYVNLASRGRFGPGRGRDAGGRGSGGGRRWRHRYYATGQPGWMRRGGVGDPMQDADPTTEKRVLEEEAEALQARLNSIMSRLKGMEPTSKLE